MINSPRLWLERELADFAASLPADALVLDAGAGDQRYRRFFGHCRYESTDFEQVDKAYAPSTYVCDLAAIPVEDDRFDAVVFTQVMEHLPDPVRAVRELARVARPGARLFYSGPMHYEEHEKPFDFYRYTQFGVRHVLEEAGWRVDDLRPLDGFMSVVAHQLRFMKRRFPRRPAGYGGGVTGVAALCVFQLCRLLFAPLVWLAARAGARHRYNDENTYPMNYLALATLPTRPERTADGTSKDASR